MNTRSPTTRLILLVTIGPQAVEQLRRAAEMADIAALIVRPPPGGALAATETRAVVEAAQGHGIAALLLDEPRLARTLGADGVHLSAGPDLLSRYSEAREIVGGRAIVAADAGASRHDAMELGEAGADYVGFSATAPGIADEEARRLRDDLVTWWADIFEPPVVALGIENAEVAAVLTAAGADFLAVDVPKDVSPGEMTAWLGPIAATVAGSHATA